MRQVFLQSERPLKIRNRFQVLEILGGSPQQKRARYQPFGQISIDLKRSLAVKLGFFQPHAGWVRFKMTNCTYIRKSGMGQREIRIARHGARKMMTRLLDQSGIARNAQAVSSN